MDPEQKTVICVTKGKDSSTWSECKKQLEAHGGKSEHITEVCMNMFYPATIAPMVLEDWIQWGLRCRLNSMVEVAIMLQNHYEGVVLWFSSKLTNGLPEGVNSLFQTAKYLLRS